MKPMKPILCLLLGLTLLSACDSREVSGPQQDQTPLPVEEVEETHDILAQMDALYEQMNKDPLPLKGADTYPALDSFDGGTQLVKDDETAKKLAGAIYNLLDAYGNGLGSYSGGDDSSMAKTTTALWHTAPIDFTWEVTRDGAFTTPHEDHALAALAKRELEEGRTPVAFYYVDEIQKTADRLFGAGTRITNMDEPPYYYYEKEGVYILMEDLGAQTVIPQILSYEKTETGFKAEAVLVNQVGGQMELNGKTLTKENIAAEAAQTQHLRYTFRDENGALTLEAIEMWRPGKE